MGGFSSIHLCHATRLERDSNRFHLEERDTKKPTKFKKMGGIQYDREKGVEIHIIKVIVIVFITNK